MSQAVSVGELWRRMVEEEHAQSESVRGPDKAPSDSWEPFAERFRPDASTEDPLVQRLLREIEPHHTVMDVGAGGGRLALPISMHCKQVVAVEPSGSMGSILEEEAGRMQSPSASVSATSDKPTTRMTAPWTGSPLAVKITAPRMVPVSCADAVVAIAPTTRPARIGIVQRRHSHMALLLTFPVPRETPRVHSL